MTSQAPIYHNGEIMNIYALFPLIAALAFIPLLITTIASRPHSRQQELFILFLIPAMMWSLADFFFRSNFFPEYSLFLLRIVLIVYVWMAVQFHRFTSSFFSPTEGRWLGVAYGSLGLVVALVFIGYFPEGVDIHGDKLYPQYGPGFIFMAVPLVVLLARNVFVFVRKLKNLDNPVLYNQIVSLLIGLFLLTAFTFAALIPWGREVPVSHFGNIANAVVLSYAVIRHKLVDIKFVVRGGLVWASLIIVGVAGYAVILFGLHTLLRFNFDFTTTLAASLITAAVLAGIYRLRGFLSATVSKALQGQVYDYRQSLARFTGDIDKVFSLEQQGAELLALVTRAVGCRKACLLFPENGSDDFTAHLFEPRREDNTLSGFRLAGHNPIVEYLRRERAPLTRMNIAVLPEFRGLWAEEKEVVRANGIELFFPLVSRGKLVGIMALDRKQSGRYTLEDLDLLENTAARVAMSMEKGFIHEQLREREEELSIINRSSSIITSSLDIRRTYDRFIKELQKVVDVSWAAITVIEDNEINFLALSSDIGSAWQVGERIPLKGTATEWVATRQKALVETDLSKESRFVTGKYHLEHGVRSVAYLPLKVEDRVIGSLILASCNARAYPARTLKLLEELSMPIAVSIENSRQYDQAEQRARIDGLTTLLNRHSLDEQIQHEISRHSRYGGVFSLIILDLDNFKSFNDNYGHLAGDELLRQVGKIMKGAIRDADQAFRYGGDEFAVLLPQTNIDSAYMVAERIRKRAVLEGATGTPVTVSLGMASWPADGIGANEVIAAADTALYHAKHSGSNQSQRYLKTLAPSRGVATERNGSEDSEVISSIYAMAASVDVRDHAGSHSKKVNQYAVALAEALNLEPLEVSRLSTCAFLHDVGKIGINDDILNKREKLTEEEWEAIKVHPRLGAAIASHARHLAPCIPGILCHHERYDGTGYPRGLKGEQIPLEARILALADSYAAMTSERYYSDALSPEQAVEEIKRGAGTQFDPHLVEVFLSVLSDQEQAIKSEKGGEAGRAAG